jgi:hypothetical protein
MTLVDTDIIADIVTPGSDWQLWSIDRIDECRRPVTRALIAPTSPT